MIRDSRSVVASLLAARRDGWGRAWVPASARWCAVRWHLYVTAARVAGVTGRIPGDRVIDGLQHQFLHLGGDPRRNRTRQPQPDFPRTTASSIACAVTAWVN